MLLQDPATGPAPEPTISIGGTSSETVLAASTADISDVLFLQPGQLDILIADDDDIGRLAADDYGGPITVTGWRGGWGYGGGGGGGGGGWDSNQDGHENGGTSDGSLASFHQEFVFDGVCSDAVAVEVLDDIYTAGKSSGYEFAITIVNNSDGTFGAYQDSIFTNYANSYVNFPAPRDGSVTGFVHNHAWSTDTSIDPFINQRSQYPSGPDWEQADKVVAEGGTSDPDNLSIYIIDVDGVIREFRYTDKAFYQSLTNQQKYDKVGLPVPLQPCPSAT